MSPQGIPAGKIHLRPFTQARKPSFAPLVTWRRGTLPLLSPDPLTGRRSGTVDAASLRGGPFTLYCALGSEGHGSVGSAVGT